MRFIRLNPEGQPTTLVNTAQIVSVVELGGSVPAPRSLVELSTGRPLRVLESYGAIARILEEVHGISDVK